MFISGFLKKKSKKTVGMALAIAFALAAHAQKNNIGHNYAAILPTDNEAAIIQKAANVAPSPRQLRWQRLELTAFFHFGVNTFTNREWGLGNEDPKIFNPVHLDAR